MNAQVDERDDSREENPGVHSTEAGDNIFRDDACMYNAEDMEAEGTCPYEVEVLEDKAVGVVAAHLVGNDDLEYASEGC